MEARNTVVSVRLDDLAVQAVDLLVQAGLAQSRSEGVAQLVTIGIRNAEELLTSAREVAGRVQAIKQEMFAAVQARDISRVQELLDQNAALANASSESGTSAVLAAVYMGARDIAELLLARGAELNLFEAAAVGARDRLKEIAGTDRHLVRAYSHDGWTALHLAAFFGHAEAAAYLLEQGAPISAVSRNGMANTPLHAALASRRTEVARVLLQAGAPIDVVDASGWRPLHLAAANGLLEMVEALLDRGAEASPRNKDGLTPLKLAREKGHDAVAALLLSQGAAE